MHDLTDMEKAKLPKWARQYIENLHRDLETALGVAEKARRPGPTKVGVGHRYGHRAGDPATADYWADDDARVRFLVGPDELHDYVEVLRVPGGIQVHAGGALFVKPQVTNVLEVLVERRDMDRNLVGVFRRWMRDPKRIEKK